MNKYDTCCPNDTAYPVGDDMVIGLTKRELFAAMAMQGILSNPYLMEKMAQMVHEGRSKDIDEYISKQAVESAYALINALNIESRVNPRWECMPETMQKWIDKLEQSISKHKSIRNE